MSDKPNYPERKRTLLDYIGLTGEKLEGADWRPTMKFFVTTDKMAGNVVRMEVKTNLPNDTNYGKIQYNMDIRRFSVFVNMLQQIIEGPPGQQIKYEFRQKRYVRATNKRSDEAMLDVAIVIGKNSEGVVGLKLLSWEKSRPDVPFVISLPYEDLIYANGKPMEKGKASELAAKGLLRNLDTLGQQILERLWVEPEKKGANGAGAGGNKGQQQQRGGQGQNRNEESGDFSSSFDGNEVLDDAGTFDTSFDF